MLNHRFIPYLRALGLLVLLATSYWGYRAYQSHIEFEEFMLRAVTFQQSLNIDTPPGMTSINSQPLQRGGSTASPTSGLATDPAGDYSTHGEKPSSPPVKVRIMTPGEVALYSDGDPNAAVRVESEPRAPVPDQTWGEDELVSQRVELPDGEIVKILAIPGLEIREGDRVSPQYIENARDKRGNYIEVDGVRYDVPIESAEDEYARQKRLWASTLDVSVTEIEQMIANRELVVKLSNESMTPEDTKINFNALRKIPRHLPFLRSTRPDLFEEEPSSNKSHIFSDPESWEIEPGGADTWVNNPLFEPIQKGMEDRQSPIPSEPSTVSNQETDTREGLSPERFEKAQRLIEQYGTEEGLRRLREVDPDAARQFERERKAPPTPDEPETR